MKKLMYLALAFIAVATGFTACMNNAKEISTLRENPDYQINHVGDSLFELNYHDYSFTNCSNYFDTLYDGSETWGCSEIKIGNIVGRNLDYCINNNACAVIRIADKENERNASIGVVGCYKDFTFDKANRGDISTMSDYIPGRTVDGINDKGVYIGVNVIPQPTNFLNGVSYVPGSKNKIIAYEADINKPYHNVMYLPRLVLDKAESLKSAIDTIKNYNWFFPIGYPTPEDKIQVFHWLIADKDCSCVIEFDPSNTKTLFTTYYPDVDQPEKDTMYLGAIMTNFTNSKYKKGIFDDLGAGYERYDILKESFKKYKDSSIDFNMLEIMQSVWYSNAYTLPFSKDDYDKFWLTELSNEYVSSDTLYHKGKEIVDNPLICDAINIYREHWNDKKRWFRNNTDLWYTVHTSVYDMNNLTLFVLPHEGGKTATDHKPKQIGRKFFLKDKYADFNKQNK